MDKLDRFIVDNCIPESDLVKRLCAEYKSGFVGFAFAKALILEYIKEDTDDEENKTK